MIKIGISTDCMCDLPSDWLSSNGVNVMQFYIHTSSGRFLNESEITSDNIVDYLNSGNAFLRSSVPEPEECKSYFEELLTRYDNVIHITTSDRIGMSYPNARAALELMGESAERVTLINSGCISTGLGHVVLSAVSLRDGGSSVSEITEACLAARGKISNSFIIPNANYLHRMGYVGPGVKDFCSFFNIHPVLYTKNGKLAIKSFRFGSYEKAVLRYIRSEFRRSRKIDNKQLFITHAGCPSKLVSQVKLKVTGLCRFDNITVTKASAFVSGCCGPATVGVMYVYR